MTPTPPPPAAPAPAPNPSPPTPAATVPRPRRSWRWVLFKWLFGLAVIVALLLGAYLFFMLKWSYSSGERAGWVQKLSHKGWFCKTWEGELAMVSMPGATPEKFYFTVWDDAVAEEINRHMGKRVSLHYEEKVGIPTTCFGETPYFVTRVTVVDQIPLAPGIVVPTQPVPAPAPGSTSSPTPPPESPAASGPAPAVPGAQSRDTPGSGSISPTPPSTPPSAPPTAPPSAPQPATPPAAEPTGAPAASAPTKPEPAAPAAKP